MRLTYLLGSLVLLLTCAIIAPATLATKTGTSDTPSAPQVLAGHAQLTPDDFAAQAVFRVKAANEFPGESTSGTAFYVEHARWGDFIVTNRHICTERNRPGFRTFILEQGIKSWSTQALVVSMTTDLCMLKVPKDVLRTHHGYRIAGSQPEVGERLTYYGHPGGYELSKNSGPYVIEFRERVNMADRLFTPNHVMNIGFILAHVIPGSSGSPLLNREGQLVGVIFAYEQAPDAPRKGLFVPLNDVERFLENQE